MDRCKSSNNRHTSATSTPHGRAAVNIEPEAKDSHASSLGRTRLLMDKLDTPAQDRVAIEAAFT